MASEAIGIGRAGGGALGDRNWARNGQDDEERSRDDPDPDRRRRLATGRTGIPTGDRTRDGRERRRKSGIPIAQPSFARSSGPIVPDLVDRDTRDARTRPSHRNGRIASGVRGGSPARLGQLVHGAESYAALS